MAKSDLDTLLDAIALIATQGKQIKALERRIEALEQKPPPITLTDTMGWRTI